MNQVLAGAIAMGSLVIALVFLRYWRDTRDRFFLFFALSFLIEGLLRIYTSGESHGSESAPHHYLLRLLAYMLILWAIIDKNLPRNKDKP